MVIVQLYYGSTKVVRIGSTRVQQDVRPMADLSEIWINSCWNAEACYSEARAFYFAAAAAYRSPRLELIVFKEMRIESSWEAEARSPRQHFNYV